MMAHFVSDIVLRGKILRWGSSYGLRIRKADLERSGLQAGDEATVWIEDPGDLPQQGAKDGSERGQRHLVPPVRSFPGLSASYWEEKRRMRGGGQSAPDLRCVPDEDR